MDTLKVILKRAYDLHLIARLRQDRDKWTVEFRDGDEIVTRDPARVIQDKIDLVTHPVVVEEEIEAPLPEEEPLVFEGPAVLEDPLIDDLVDL